MYLDLLVCFQIQKPAYTILLQKDLLLIDQSIFFTDAFSDKPGNNFNLRPDPIRYKSTLISPAIFIYLHSNTLDRIVPWKARTAELITG